ncbi:patatin-like phospholipase family protein [Pontixanthobacter aestiaquae]|uniref:PNPLA domain-containing protein n=1 Tax=Pontixanthobacter aestiaquae TaxID=1509367 RepID=A0A844Z9E3_9SPHN|nr:patatin-like phospholipase family protein [Pontixanthobacter aestiaquae]MDN3645184.1 patatin-like phospholipase family protein [Pontixanthobacter aestiaquae]MXO83816.1 hypothetical protein [Pontixanthobacter aestiaquae]
MSYKIIAFDGGGIRGLVSALLLKELDPNGELVKGTNMFAGTSTGSFMALALADGVPLDTIIDMYQTKGSEIFEEAPVDWNCANPFSVEEQQAIDAITVDRVDGEGESIKSIFQAKYKPDNLRSELGRIFGAAKLSELPMSGAQVVVNSLQLWSEWEGQWSPVMIGSGRNDPFAEMHMVDAAMCSGAAPTYFPPHEPVSPASKQWGYFADGGLFANNPSASAVSYAVENFGADVSNMRVLSIGTGKTRQGINPGDVGKADCWGAWQWLRPSSRDNGKVPAAPLIEAALTASAASCEQYAKRMLGNHYIRANLDLEQAYALDNWQDIGVLEEAVAKFVQTDGWDVIVDAVYAYWNNPNPLAFEERREEDASPKRKSWLASLFA